MTDGTASWHRNSDLITPGAINTFERSTRAVGGLLITPTVKHEKKTHWSWDLGDFSALGFVARFY